MQVNFIITLTFMDGKVQEIQVSEDEIQNFMSAIGKKEVYFNLKKGSGIWFDIDKIRFFQVNRENGDAK